MDPQLLAFQQAGLADAVAVMGRSVTIAGVVYPGVRSELVVNPGQVQPGGFKYRRAFSMRFNDPTLTATLKAGMAGVDDTGQAFKIISWKPDHLGVLYDFGSVNA